MEDLPGSFEEIFQPTNPESSAENRSIPELLGSLLGLLFLFEDGRFNLCVELVDTSCSGCF